MTIPITVRRILYDLKRRCNLSAVITTTIVGDTDMATGLKSRTTTPYTIDRVVCLPVMIQNRYLSDVTYQSGDKIVIVDSRDLPDTFTWEDINSITLEGGIYQLVSYDTTDFDSSYFCVLRRTQNE